MCSGDKILPILKGRQVKQKPLKCLVSSKCWCMRVQTRLTHHTDDCMSPVEMLAQTSVKLSQDDVVYLQGLVNREFIPFEEK